jgi:hypothetical protein
MSSLGIRPRHRPRYRGHGMAPAPGGFRYFINTSRKNGPQWVDRGPPHSEHTFRGTLAPVNIHTHHNTNPCPTAWWLAQLDLMRSELELGAFFGQWDMWSPADAVHSSQWCLFH